ncbi:MAG: orotate phosphoribosyltransferase [Methylotenera sp.]|nr:orotate phosphoribosyltransferase [Oligoflexia bacterium]
MSLQNLKKDLLNLIREKSYREGDFTLASGQKSNFYIDLKATTLHSEGAYLIGKLTIQTLKDRAASLTSKIQGVGGLTLGADPLATSVSLASREAGLHWPAYIVRKEPKAHGTSKYIEGTENLPEGAQVLVIEDVVTTGGSSLKAIERLREAGYRPVAVLTVVDREQGGEEVFRNAGVEYFSLLTITEIRSR